MGKRDAIRWCCAVSLLGSISLSGWAAGDAASNWKTRLAGLQKKYPQYGELIGKIKQKRTELESQEASLKASLSEKKTVVKEKAGAVKQAVTAGKTDALKEDAAKLGQMAKGLSENKALKQDMADQMPASGQPGVTVSERYDMLKQNHPELAAKEAKIEQLKKDISGLESQLQAKIQSVKGK